MMWGPFLLHQLFLYVVLPSMAASPDIIIHFPGSQNTPVKAPPASTSLPSTTTANAVEEKNNQEELLAQLLGIVPSATTSRTLAFTDEAPSEVDSNLPPTREISPARISALKEKTDSDKTLEGFSEVLEPIGFEDQDTPVDDVLDDVPFTKDPLEDPVPICSNTTEGCLIDEKITKEELDQDDLTDRIVGGFVSEKGKWNWIAAIMYTGKDLPTTGIFCGGALITRRHVLTAAHCMVVYSYKVHNPADLTVRLGEHDLNRNEGTERDFGVYHIYMHPKYHLKTQNNDIAILSLDQRAPKVFTWGLYLPGSLKPHPTNQYLTVIGWGKTSFHGSSSNLLREANIPVWSDANCLQTWDSKLYKPGFQLCAGEVRGGVDSCQGDSGGPFVSGRKGAYVLEGIVSAGKKCALPNQPGLYTRVQAYISWIYQVTQKQLEPSCKTTDVGTEYRGTIYFTKSRIICQRWDSNSPHEVVVGSSQPENYCRNPTNDVNGPWCYTNNARKRIEHCDIPKCATFSANINAFVPSPTPISTKRPSENIGSSNANNFGSSNSNRFGSSNVNFGFSNSNNFGSSNRNQFGAVNSNFAGQNFQGPGSQTKCYSVPIGFNIVNTTCVTVSVIQRGALRYQYTKTHWETKFSGRSRFNFNG